MTLESVNIYLFHPNHFSSLHLYFFLKDTYFFSTFHEQRQEIPKEIEIEIFWGGSREQSLKIIAI